MKLISHYVPRLRDLLRRSTETVEQATSTHHNNYNLIRLILATTVIYYHSFAIGASNGYTEWVGPTLFYPYTDLGSLAVDVFFFLSGLFVSQSFFRDRSTIDFVLKRVSRIWPGLVVCLIVTVAICGMITRGLHAWTYLYEPSAYDYISNNAVFRLRWTVADIFAHHKNPGINGSIHTLPLEMKMYVVLAAAGFCGLLSRRWLIVLFGLAVIGIDFAQPALFQQLFIVNGYGKQQIGMFFLGVATCGLSRYIRPRLWHIALIVLIMQVAGLQTRTLLFFLLTAVVTLCIGQSKLLGRVGRLRSDYSYGIYIYGYPSEQMVVSMNHHITPYTLTICATLLAAVFAIASWHLIEKPAMQHARLVVAMRRRLARNLQDHARKIGLPRIFWLGHGQDPSQEKPVAE